MNKRLYLRCLRYFILLVLVGSSHRMSVARADNETPITDPTRPININNNNKTFTIRLKSNPSTGFIWLIREYDPRLLTIIKHEFVPPATMPKPGEGGIETWTFEASASAFIAPQLTQIHFIYARPWELTNNSDTNITVVSN